jgi:hypothetical protein
MAKQVKRDRRSGFSALLPVLQEIIPGDILKAEKAAMLFTQRDSRGCRAFSSDRALTLGAM